MRPAQGVCEVILYTPRHATTLADAPLEQIYKLVQVWTDRFREPDAVNFAAFGRLMLAAHASQRDDLQLVARKWTL